METGVTGGPAATLESVFDAERAETIRTRLRWIFPAATVVLVISWLFVDSAAFTRAQATWIRAPECAVSLFAWWFLRRPRSVRVIESLAVGVWAVVAAAAAYGLLVAPEPMLAAKVEGHVLSALVVCVLASLGWQATTLLALLSLFSLAALKARHADHLITATFTTIGFAYGIVVVSAAARDRSKRAEVAARLALAAANDRLARDDEVRRRLFVNLSHDLRTPLAVVRGEAATLRASGRFAEDDAALYRVEANARALGDLADQLLDLARLDAGQMPRRASACDVGRIAREVASLLDAPGRGPIATPAGDPVVALVDPSHLRRILGNLVANALRHAPDDVVIEAKVVGARVVVDVIDGGPGVRPERRAAIFERFVSFDSDGSAASGIGVPLARELAEHNGGTLELVEAAKTTFRLTLPATDSAPVDDVARDLPLRPPVAPAPELTGSSGPRLLIVEDNADMAALLGRVLGAQFRVASVGRVDAALSALASDPPEVVLSDVMLPDGSGYDVLSAMRAHRELDGVPLVLVSALGEVDERVRGLSAGADDYVAKPFAPEELLSRVMSAVSRARARRRALEAQRETMLMEIHDGVSASLSRAAMLLTGARTGGRDADEAVGFARAAIADGLDEVRAIARLLAPRATTWPALSAEIRRATAEACAAAAIALNFEASDDAAERAVQPAVAHTLRRVVREATTNAIKHSRARSLTCRLSARADEYRVRVEDDGVGLPADEGEGRGLGIMRRRVERAGGEIEIGNAQGAGVFVEARLPYRALTSRREPPAHRRPTGTAGSRRHACRTPRSGTRARPRPAARRAARWPRGWWRRCSDSAPIRCGPAGRAGIARTSRRTRARRRPSSSASGARPRRGSRSARRRTSAPRGRRRWPRSRRS
jgi:signal transduction histidine kinase